MADKTPADRRHDLWMLIIGFLLTTVAGGIITALFQSRQELQHEQADGAKRSSELTEQRRTAATGLFDELVVLIDTRMFRTRQLIWALDKPNEFPIRRREYREILEKWNDRLNRNRALLCRYFGPRVGAAFETTVIPGLNGVHTMLADAISKHEKSRSVQDQLTAAVNDLNPETYELSNMMAEAIRRGDVGSTDTEDACDFQPKKPHREPPTQRSIP